MKLHVIHFPSVQDLPQSVRDSIPDAPAQEILLQSLNRNLANGVTEMHAYIKAYRDLEDAGYDYDEGEKQWNVRKENPTVGDVHVDRPMGSVRPKDQGDDEDELEIPLQKALFDELLRKAGKSPSWDSVHFEVPLSKEDIVSLDVPLFIRLLELAREDIKTDPPIHEVTERITQLLENKDYLGMEDYDAILASIEKREKEKDDPGTQDVTPPTDGPLLSVPPVAGTGDAERKRKGKRIAKRISGNSAIELNTEGKALADKLGERLALRGGFDILYSSPLKRGKETADEIASHMKGVKRREAPELQPWHLGEMEGKKTSEVKDQLDYYIEHPDEIPPGKGADGERAESFNAGKCRQLAFQKKLYDEFEEADPTLKVGEIMHSRGMALLRAWVDQGMPDDFEIDMKDVEDPDDYPHATVLRWHKGEIDELDIEDDEPLKPGLYLILHSLTDDDTDEGNEDLKKADPDGGKEAIPSTMKYLAPVEVCRAAKRAYESGVTVLDITSPLAENEGLDAEHVAKIAEYFNSPEAGGDAALKRDAWGGEDALRWATRVAKKIEKDKNAYEPWIGYDLDGTLAEPLESYSGTAIGEPKPGMVERVKRDLAEGKRVKIFTARVADDPDGEKAKAIQEWCKVHIGTSLPVTNRKDPGMTKLIDDRAEPPENIEKAGSGVMLAFWPSKETAERLAVKGGEPSDQLHVTLAYFGKLSEMKMDVLPALEKAVEHFANTHAPLQVTFGGLGRFPATPQSDGQDVTYLGVHSDKIQKFREELVDAVKALGVEPKSNFGYNPHMTLKFVPPHSPHLLPTPEPESVIFDRIVLSMGTAKKEYPLVGTDNLRKHDFEIAGEVIKLDSDRRLVFGWFSIVSVDGKPFADTQGDVISEDTLEDSAYEFVLDARVGGEMHQSKNNGEVRGVGRLVESVVFTKEKQEAMTDSLRKQGIPAEMDLHCIAWWGGMKIDSPDTWKQVKAGRLKAWSIGGKGKRMSFAD